jgi:hypothetical protein
MGNLGHDEQAAKRFLVFEGCIDVVQDLGVGGGVLSDYKLRS